MRTEINGEGYGFEVRADEPAIEVIRDRAGLTGTKLVCGTGVCGACTVLLDGVPVVSCLLPAHALEGRSVRTVEGSDEDLHPVQRAFMGHDALQCGFCTPGFVVGAMAFYDVWRRERGTVEPPREEVARALSGHLCRCGAYPGIFAAVAAACRGESDEGVVHRREAREKVTGRARYTVDVRYEGQLEGRILRSPHAHARVSRIDASGAEAMPGVRAVVDLVDEKRIVRYVGQEIAAVAAVDHVAAQEALSMISVEYEVLPAVIGMEVSRETDAQQVYQKNRGNAPSSAEMPLPPARWRGNVRGPTGIPLSGRRRAVRRIEVARRRGDPNLVEGTWRTAVQSHTALEPHACVAHWRDDGLTVHLSTQAVEPVARRISKRWKLAPDKVRVLAEHVGGGFGAKLELSMEAIAAIELSRKSGAPVRVVLDRLEELTVGGHRPGAEMEVALLAGEDRTLAALSTRVYGDGGVAIGSVVATLMRFIYPGAKELLDYDVVNHTPPGKPFRGPGGPVACWALEGAVDEMAHRLGEDPISLRRRWDPHRLRNRLYDWVEGIPAWRDRGPAGVQKGRFRRGVGVAAGNWFYFLEPGAKVELAVGPEGLVASTASQDIGTGSRTVVARGVAEVFGISPDDVEVRLGDSRSVRGPRSGGSRSTPSLYPAAIHAAEQLRERLLEETRGRLGAGIAEAGRGGVNHPGGHVPWGEVFADSVGTSVVGTRRRDRKRYVLPVGYENVRVGRGYTGAVHVSEVEVDTLLGKVRPLRVWGGLAAGRVVAPEPARNQCYGAVVQGIGYALYEERQLDPNTGLVLSMGLEEYRIPGIGDTPEIEIHFLDEGFEHVRDGAVGLGELSTLAVAASVGNAVFNATGWRPYELPIRPDRLLAGVGL